MGKNRLEAFSDGVIAIVITVMVLELKAPASATIGSDREGNLSCVLYLAGALASLKAAWLGLAVYAAVAVVWMVPDRRIEKQARRLG